MSSKEPSKKRSFPSMSGVFLGLILGVLTLVTEHTSPFWITFNVILRVCQLITRRYSRFVGLSV